MAEAAGARRAPAGWRVVAAKEFADHLLSVRFTILLVIMGLALVAAVYGAAGGIRGAVERSSDLPALFLRIFTEAPERIPPFFAWVGILAPLLGIAFAFDAVNGERAQRTLPRLLAQPIYRDDVVNGKFVAGLSVIGLNLAGLTLLVAGVGLLRLGVVPTAREILRLIAFLVVSIVYAGFWLAVSMWFSIVLRRAATSALAAIAAWLVATLFAGLLVGIVADVIAPLPDQPTVEEVLRNVRTEQGLGRLFPATLYEEATVVLLRPEVRALGILLPQQIDRAVPGELSLDQSLLIVWPQVTGLVALTAICFIGAYTSFMRQEVRA